jgi:hypothetical protein
MTMSYKNEDTIAQIITQLTDALPVLAALSMQDPYAYDQQTSEAFTDAWNSVLQARRDVIHIDSVLRFEQDLHLGEPSGFTSAWDRRPSPPDRSSVTTPAGTAPRNGGLTQRPAPD